MTAGAWALLAVAALVAVGDWFAVARERKPLEYVCKPLTMVALVAVALAVHVDHDAVRWWFVGALVLSLAGDVFLMLPGNLFVAGLASFLVGHLAYVAGMWTSGVDGVRVGLGVAVVVVALALIGRPILRAVRRGSEPEMALPVLAYMVVISAMVASAIGTGVVLAITGAGLFYCSDALIAWRRFVRERPWQPLAIIVTYHVAQAGLVLALTR